MEKTIRIGLAGYGRSGRDIHANYLKTDPRFRIVAVADALPERREDAVKELGCAVYNDFHELLDAGGFDLFVNATPSRFHAEAVRLGLQRFPAVAEKPIAPNLAEFDRLLAVSRETGHALYPFQNSRFYPHYRKVHEIVDSGILGQIMCVRLNYGGFARRWDWQTRQDQLGGNLYNTGPHPLDQAILFFGESMPKVFCSMAAYHWGLGGDANNFCALTLYGENAPTVEVAVSSFQAYPQGELVNIQGTLGGLTSSFDTVRWKFFDPAKAPKQTFWKPWSDNRQYCGETLPWTEMSCSFGSQTDFFTLAIGGFYNHLHDVIEGKADFEIKLDQVRRQVAVLEEAHRQNPLPKKEL